MSDIKLSKRNLITSILVLVIIVFAWQIYELFWEDSLPQDMPSVPKASQMPLVAAKAPTTTILPTPAGAISPSASTGETPPPSSLASDDSPANSSAAAGSSAAVDPSSDTQSEYLRLVNQYQMAQLQRMIAEDNEAIAIARKNAAQAMSETTKLAGDGSVPISATSDDSGTTGYALVYTGQQSDGTWSATLKKDGQTFDVAVGKPLPDGSQVISVDENGVLISQSDGAVKKLITFSGEVTLGVPGTTSTDSGSSAPTTNNPMIDQTAIIKSTPPSDTSNESDTSDASSDANVPAATSANPASLQDKGAVDASKPAIVSAQNANTAPVLAAKTTNTQKSNGQVAVNDQSSSSSNSYASAFSRMSDIMQGNQAQPAKSSAAIAAAISNNPVKVESSTQTVAASAPVTNKATVAVSSDPAPVVQAPTHPTAAPVVVAQTQQTTIQKNANTSSVAVAKTTVDSYDTAEKNILAANPRSYTIQLTSDRQLASVLDFINRHHLEGKATYFHAYTRRGDKLYVLVQGEYPSQEAAQQAVAELPVSVRQEGAFVQAYATVQGMIHKPDFSNAA